MATKRAQAINGDVVTIEHPDADLSLPYSSFANVRFGRTIHFAQSFAPSARPFVALGENVGQFGVAGGDLQVFQRTEISEVGETAEQYRGVWTSAQGLLVVATHDGTEQLVSLVEALNPSTTALGVVIAPTAPASFVSHASVAVHVPGLATLETAPLTAEVLATVPPWEGSDIGAAELFAGSVGGEGHYLVHVSDTARTNAIPGDSDLDRVTDLTTDLRVDWQT